MGFYNLRGAAPSAEAQQTFIYLAGVWKSATKKCRRMPAEWIPMSEYQRGCPECSMSFGMSSVLSRRENEFTCTSNPAHRFTEDTNGFLKSL